MKKLPILLLGLLLARTAVTAQHVYTNTLERDKKPTATPLFVDSSEAIKEKLVQLALAGPRYKQTEHANTVSDLALIKAKNQWLNLLTVSTNYNDQTFTNKNSQFSNYPKYFFGVNIPIGIFFTRGSEIKTARENQASARNQQDELAREIRAQVLEEYEQYKSQGELIRVQSMVIEDEQALFIQTEQKFRDGTVSLADYNSASKALNNEVAKRISLQMQQKTYKLELEKYIGIPLEEALRH